MCGICGKVTFGENPPPVNFELIQSMTNSLVHRGPDNAGYYIHKNIGLGFRRLKIIDLVTGDQPITNEDGSIQLIFNGEIYNYQILRSQLINKGHVFSTSTDTEVIIHAYEEYGTKFVNYLRGMFAIALWDPKNDVLILARDRLGKKPLFFSFSSSYLIFASEIKAILQDRQVNRELDLCGIDMFLTYKYIPAPHSIIKSLKKVMPGSILICDLKTRSIRQEVYWEIDISNKRQINEFEAIEELRSKLDEAVKYRMISDVPIGALLSGGIDSSIIVSLMAKNSTGPINTFSIGFDEKDYNELDAARSVADRYRTTHHEIILKPDVMEILPDIVWYLDEPMADSSVVPTYYVCQAARQNVTVVLNGDGGDECFGGYNSYRAIKLDYYYGLLPDKVRHGFIDPVILKSSNVKSDLYLLSRLSRFVQSSYLPLPNKFLRWMQLFNNDQRLSLYRPEVMENFGKVLETDQPSENYLLDKFEAYAGCPSDIDKVTAVDLNTYLPGDLLVKMDRMSMANSIEARSPLLDQEIVEWSVSLPDSYKIKLLNGKYILKQAFKNDLPPALLRRKKHGFGIPINKWLRTDLHAFSKEIIFDKSSIVLELFNEGLIRDMIAAHKAGHIDCSQEIWSLMVFSLWYEKVIKQ
ncbi:MAG: asparagine synthase (glutamine-hydrolyzing) [Anaerolineaceae bacterium]|nr:asparagine synthase (glutamine-hydrolyzing) [Anaerolineaceae bacterium]